MPDSTDVVAFQQNRIPTGQTFAFISQNQQMFGDYSFWLTVFCLEYVQVHFRTPHVHIHIIQTISWLPYAYEQLKFGQYKRIHLTYSHKISANGTDILGFRKVKENIDLFSQCKCCQMSKWNLFYFEVCILLILEMKWHTTHSRNYHFPIHLLIFKLCFIL